MPDVAPCPHSCPHRHLESVSWWNCTWKCSIDFIRGACTTSSTQICLYLPLIKANNFTAPATFPVPYPANIGPWSSSHPRSLIPENIGFIFEFLSVAGNQPAPSAKPTSFLLDAWSSTYNRIRSIVRAHSILIPMVRVFCGIPEISFSGFLIARTSVPMCVYICERMSDGFVNSRTQLVYMTAT